MFPKTDKTLQTFIENTPTLDSHTLVLASVDFSHHLDETFARFHDAKSIEAIQYGQDFSQTEVDCQNCLKFITDLAHRYNKPYFELINRTSVDTITGSPSWIGNTSHIFGIFRENKEEQEKQIFDEYNSDDTKIYGAFFWDTMFARDFHERQKSDVQFIDTMFEEFFQENTLSKTGVSFYHTKLYGFDFVGLNLETVIGTEQNCETNKPNGLSFISSPTFLSHLKQIGVTIVNIANNHTNDCGEVGYKNTEKFIAQSWIESFGNSTILKKEVE